MIPALQYHPEGPLAIESGKIKIDCSINLVRLHGMTMAV
jgi:hypothetical protein